MIHVWNVDDINHRFKPNVGIYSMHGAFEFTTLNIAGQKTCIAPDARLYIFLSALPDLIGCDI